MIQQQDWKDGKRCNLPGKTWGDIFRWACSWGGVYWDLREIPRLVAACGEKDSSHLWAHFHEECPQRDRVVSRLFRLARGEPWGHVLGWEEFWGWPWHVSPQVLMPRPDSEVVVSLAKNLLAFSPKMRVLDIGMGSGCLGLTLASLFPQVELEGWDVHWEALKVAEKNRELRNLSKDRVLWLQRDIFDDFTWKEKKSFDLIISNPPYIAWDDSQIHPQVKAYEPHLALFGEGDGLAFYEKLAEKCHALLAPQGTRSLCLEIGYNQPSEVWRIFRKWDWLVSPLHRDSGGQPRAFVVQKKGIGT